MKLFSKRLYLSIEFALLFIGIPLFLIFDWKIIHPSIILLPVVILIFVYLKNNPGFKFNDLIKFNISRILIIQNLLIIGITAILLTLAVYLFDRNNLFNLPRKNYLIWIILCVLYPIFSAFLQEIIYKIFLFKRYEELFKSRWLLILASGLTFSFAHIVYFSVVSIILTLILGTYLAYMYDKTKSVLFTAIFHGICGDLIFTVGLGHYFWLDMYKFM